MADQPSAPSPAATPQLETAQTETETPPAEASHDLLEANPELEEEEVCILLAELAKSGSGEHRRMWKTI